jgi:hypothetical protein
MKQTMTQTEYAAYKGFGGKSYVTKLKQQGRIVMTPDNRVDVAASDALFAQTADPNRVDVKERHAAARRAKAAPDSDLSDEPVFFDAEEQADRRMKMKYEALTKKVDYEKLIRTLREAQEVESIAYSSITELRVRMEQIADTMAPELAAVQDENTVRAMLRAEIRHALEATARRFEALYAAAKP